MGRLAKQVVATVNPERRQVIVSGADINGLMVTIEADYRTLGSGAVVIGINDLGALEVACFAEGRPIRIQSRRQATR